MTNYNHLPKFFDYIIDFNLFDVSKKFFSDFASLRYVSEELNTNST